MVEIFDAHSLMMSLALVYLLFSSFSRKEREIEVFEETTVQRINVVEPNGDLKMVVSNKVKQHPGMFNGEFMAPRERPPGIIFFNEEQDDVSGLIYQGNKEEGPFRTLSVDQYKNDQIMQLKYNTNKEGESSYGLHLSGRDEDFTIPKLLHTLDSLGEKEVPGKDVPGILHQMNQEEPLSAQGLFVGSKFNKHTVFLFRMNLVWIEHAYT